MPEDYTTREPGEKPEAAQAPATPEGEGAPRRPLTFGEDLRKEYKPRKKGGFALRIIALAVVAAVVVVTVIMVRGWAPPPAEETDTTTLLLELSRDDVAGVTIALAGEEPYTVEKLADVTAAEYRVAGWAEDTPRNTTNLSDIYGLTRLEATATVEEAPANLSQYGLDQPASVATLTMRSGESHVLSLGAKTPAADGYYLLKDNAVYTVGTYVGTRMLRTERDMRDVDILPEVSAENADYIRIERRDGQTLEMRQQEAGVTLNTWKILQPREMEAGSEAVSNLVADMNAVKLNAYVATAEDLAPYGLDDPAAKVMLKDSTGARKYFEVGDAQEGDTGNVYVRLVGENDVYTMSETLLSFLERATLTSVVDRFASIINIANVEGIRFETADKAYDMTIEREEQLDENGEVKKLTDGSVDYLDKFYINGTRVDDPAFRKLYQQIISITMRGEVQGEIAGEPAYKVSFTFNNGTEPMQVAYYPYRQDYYAISTNGDDPIFYAYRDVADTIGGLAETVLAMPVAADAALLEAIEITDTQGQTRLFSREGGVTTYRGKSLPSEQMDKAYKNLLGPSLQDVQSTPPQGSPVMTIEYRYSDGRAPIKVEYRNAAGGLYLLSIQGKTCSLLLSQQSIENYLEDFEKWIAGS